MTASAMRQHLSTLVALGLVETREERGRSGRPRLAYYLGSAAQSVFPATYEAITLDLLEMAESLDVPLVEQLFDRRRDLRVAAARQRLANKSFDNRVTELAQILEEDGYLAEAVKIGEGEWRLIEYNCAILEVAIRYGSACSSELSFLREVMPDAAIERTSHMLGTSYYCGYLVRALTLSNEAVP